MKLLIMQFSPTSGHIISLRSKYSPQHPVLKHPQSMILPERSRSFSSIQNRKQNYNFVYSNFYVSRQHTSRSQWPRGIRHELFSPVQTLG
jgi:hypothetical protein